MSDKPQAVFHKLAVGTEGRVFGVGMWRDDDCLMALDTAPLRLAWSKPMPRVGQPDVLGVVGDELWWGDLQSPRIRCFSAATGEERGTISVDDTSGVQAIVDMGDGTVIVHSYPSNRLVRLATNGEPRKLWPPSGFFGKLFGSEHGGLAFTKPIARPGAVTQGRIGRAHGGGLVILTTLGGATVGLLDGAGALLRKTLVADLVLFSSSPEAGPDGTIFLVGSSAEGGAAWVVPPSGEPSLLRGQTIEHLDPGEQAVGLIGAAGAVGPDGTCWIADTGGIERVSPSGEVLWRHLND